MMIFTNYSAGFSSSGSQRTYKIFVMLTLLSIIDNHVESDVLGRFSLIYKRNNP